MSRHNGLIPGVKLWSTSKPFTDQRGYFYEKYNRDFLVSKNIAFIQENISMSRKGTIRGLHWQSHPNSL